MAKFKATISYENCYFEETIEIDAETLGKARIKCEEIKTKNNELVAEISKKNIYTNRVIKNCELKNINWRDELLGIDIGLKLEESKDNI